MRWRSASMKEAGGTLTCGLVQLDVFQRDGIEFGFQPGKRTFLRVLLGQHAVHALQRFATLLQAVDIGLQLLLASTGGLQLLFALHHAAATGRTVETHCWR
jgi:hypothetical protein